MTLRIGLLGNAPSEKEERKGQRDPRRLKEPYPDTVRSGTAGAVGFAGKLMEEVFNRLFVRWLAQDPVFEGGGPSGLTVALELPLARESRVK